MTNYALVVRRRSENALQFLLDITWLRSIDACSSIGLVMSSKNWMDIRSWNLVTALYLIHLLRKNKCKAVTNFLGVNEALVLAFILIARIKVDRELGLLKATCFE